MNIELTNSLTAYLHDTFPDWQGIKIANIEDLTTGWESTIYAVSLAYQQNSKQKQSEIILRIYPGDNAGEKSLHEFQGMQMLFQAGYPVPQVYMVVGNPSPIGKAFMLLERIPGEMMWSVYDRGSHHRQGELLNQFCDLFVRLHKLDWRFFVESPPEFENGGGYFFVDRWIKDAKHLLVDYGKQEYLPVIGWLTQHRGEIAAHKPSIVHNDFHPANILVTPQDSAVVIDWTGWQVSDYRFDLAWTLLLARVYGGEEMRRSILSGYEKAASESVENLEYFEVCACARRLFDVTTSLALGAERLGMRPEAVESMRSQVHHLSTVYEILHAHTHLRIKQIEQLLSQDLQG